MLRLGAVGARHRASYDSTTVGHGIMPLKSHARGKLNIDTLHFFFVGSFDPFILSALSSPFLEIRGHKRNSQNITLPDLEE